MSFLKIVVYSIKKFKSNVTNRGTDTFICSFCPHQLPLLPADDGLLVLLDVYYGLALVPFGVLLCSFQLNMNMIFNDIMI